MYNQDTLVNFIRENRDKFEVQTLPGDHTEKFLIKLNQRIRHFISIVPYLVKVAVATVLIFTASVMIWNNYIRKDRHEISLRNKIILVFDKITKTV
jgi:hypothetical protein